MRSWFRLCLKEDNIQRIYKSLTDFVGRGELHYSHEITAYLEEFSEDLRFRFPPRNTYEIIGHIYAAKRVLQRLQALERTHKNKP